MKVTPELIRKFRHRLAEIGQERSIEEAENILRTMLKFVRSMKKTSQAELWEGIDQFKEQNPEMKEDEFQKLISLLYHAKEL